MYVITNPKIGGFIPQWSEFRGFSILFDNPADRLLPMDGNSELSILYCDLMSQKLELYKVLFQTLSMFPEITSTYLFCPLPFQSYHVTLWDGINDANVHNVLREHRFDAEDLINELPNSILTTSKFIELNGSSLSINMEDSIEFQFDKLVKWDNSVLVALLKPSNSVSDSILKRIEKERRSLINKYKELFGLQTSSDSYSPHVSLGYFANKELAELATPMIECWNDQFESSTLEQSITFLSNSLYGFNNMATFFKKKQSNGIDQ